MILTLLLIAIINSAAIAYLVIDSRKFTAAAGSALLAIYQLTTQLHKKTDFNRICIQYCLVCLRPYLLAIQNKAIDREDFEEANECKEIIQTIEDLIKYTGEKDDNKEDEK